MLEAGIKSVKNHLKRILHDYTPTFEEWTTLLAKIECNLNSRPLGLLHDDPEDINILTPGHFLMGKAPNAVPVPSLLDINTGRLSRWQFIQHVNETFWTRWRNEYLHTLQLRQKWRLERENLSVNEVVLIRDLPTPPSKWLLARVIEVHLGDDGKARSAIVRSSTSTYIWPIVKLIPLRVSDAMAVGSTAGGEP